MHKCSDLPPRLDRFLARLRRFKATDILSNPYRERALLANLRAYLELLYREYSPRLMLVGEALGFRGGKLTGIPFSSGKLLSRTDHPFLQHLNTNLHLSVVESENTATMVWDYLVAKNEIPLCWNAMPFHPHRLNRPHSNRAPTAAEIELGIIYLRELQEMFQPSHIVALGNKASHASRLAFPSREVIAVRHRSFGGKAKFVAGMDRLLNELD